MAVRKTLTAKKTAIRKKGKKPSASPWRFLIPIAVFLLAVILILTALLFSRRPEVPVEQPRAADLAFQGKLLQRVMTEVLRGAPAESELVLTADEVAGLFRLADHLYMLAPDNSGDTLPPRCYQVKFTDGKFDLVIPYDTKQRWLFGGFIRLAMTVRPEKADDLIDLDVSRFRAGAYPLPGWIVAKIAAAAIDGNREDANFQKFNRAVKSIFTDDNGKLHIVYRPVELQKLIWRP